MTLTGIKKGSQVVIEYIAYKFGFFHEGHRAINDCLAGVHLLAQQLPKSQVPVLKELLTQSKAIRFKLYAVNSPYDSKELLKARGYRWSMSQNDKYRAWSIELNEDCLLYTSPSPRD